MFHSENALDTLWLRGSIIESVTYSQNAMIWILKDAYVSPQNENNPSKWYRSVEYIALFVYNPVPAGFALDELGWPDTPVYRPQVDKPLHTMREYLQTAIEKTAVIAYQYPLGGKLSHRFGIMTSIPGYFPFERFHIDLAFSSAIAEWSGYRPQVFESENKLHTFAFHDARIEKILWDGPDMTWILSGACVTTKNKNNRYQTDMAAGLVTLTFSDYSISMLLCEPESELPAGMFRQLIQDAGGYRGDHLSRQHGWQRSHIENASVCDPIQKGVLFRYRLLRRALHFGTTYLGKAWYIKD